MSHSCYFSFNCFWCYNVCFSPLWDFLMCDHLCVFWYSQPPWVGDFLLVLCIGLSVWLGIVWIWFCLKISCFIHLWWLKVLLGIVVWAEIRSLNVCIMLDQDLLAFIVSIEMSGIILIVLPLHVTWSFPFAALNILSLLCMF